MSNKSKFLEMNILPKKIQEINLENNGYCSDENVNDQNKLKIQKFDDDVNEKQDSLPISEPNKADTEKKEDNDKLLIKIADDNDDEDEFYSKAKFYWSHQPATVNGMLGGFSLISVLDVKGSEKFLSDILKHHEKNYCLDCGAGIGRVSKNLLMPIFQKCDLVEQDLKFSEKAKEDLQNNSKLGKIYNVGLQKFQPDLNKYDLIWCQWVLGHLTDDDLIKFFRRMRNGLNRNGLLIIKENVTSSNRLVVDDLDSSVTRSLGIFKKCLKLAHYKVTKMVRQNNFPKGLFPVYMIAAVPIF